MGNHLTKINVKIKCLWKNQINQSIDLCNINLRLDNDILNAFNNKHIIINYVTISSTQINVPLSINLSVYLPYLDYIENIRYINYADPTNGVVGIIRDDKKIWYLVIQYGFQGLVETYIKSTISKDETPFYLNVIRTNFVTPS